ncbi:MAG TPA: type II toxin-antitoxin system RatA family toxin [Casimicrobiaceae bacterium]|nr:type II toxin-antitoxin system RatA family toxin [Casimicrobiaceae bacterium]
MASVSKSVLVEHSVEQMFDLVERVEDYPAFLPWCGGTTILERTPTALVARIDINYHGVRANFTTVNRNERPQRIVIELRDGPFRRLDGIWHFQPLAPTACKVVFDLRYEFAGPVLERLIGPVFDHIATTFIDAFVKRADDVHKQRS